MNKIQRKVQLQFALIAIIMAFFLSSCSKEDQTNVKEKVDSTTSKIGKEIDTLVSSVTKGDTIFESVTVVEVDTSKLAAKEIRLHLNDIFAHYIEIKEAIDDNDSADAQRHAKKMLEVIVEAQNDTGGKIDKKAKFTPDKIKKVSQQIESATSLDKQRQMFNELSTSMIGFIKEYGLSNKTIYQLRCSKALSGKPATWLSDSKKSDNPYYDEEKDTVKCVEVIAAWEFD